MHTITLPQKIKYVPGDENSGMFEIEGCYPGYGATIGNALRRVLLSSLSGAAIVSVKIKGVKHEFSTIPNAAEDVIQIILNLKRVRFDMRRDEPIKISLKAKGEKEVTAKMIECPADIEVVNKDAHIASLTSAKSELELEMEVSRGIGYVPVEQQEREKKEVGVIAVDAIYTPIRKVNYEISNMRLGKRTDFEKISLEIKTDGSLTPKEAFQKAVAILLEQFKTIFDFESGDYQIKEEKSESLENVSEKIVDEKKIEKNKIDKNDILEKEALEIPIANLKNFSTRTLNVLEKSRIEKVGDILKMTEDQINNLPGMGAKGIKEIKKAMGDFGFTLKK